jgi:hypothetical protein
VWALQAVQGLQWSYRCEPRMLSHWRLGCLQVMGLLLLPPQLLL